MEQNALALYISFAALVISTLTFFRASWLDRRTRVAAFVKAARPAQYTDGEFAYIGLSLSDRANLYRALDRLLRMWPAVEVVNRSLHTIFVDEVSFLDPKNLDAGRAVISASKVAIPPGPVPYKLEPMQSATFYAPSNTMEEILFRYSHIQVAASHGYVKMFKIDNLAWLRTMLRSANHEQVR